MDFDRIFTCVRKTLTFNIEKECIVYLISQGLSIGMVVFSVVPKIPQIINLYKNKSSKGLSIFSIQLTIISMLFFIYYQLHNHYSFITFGEIVIYCLEDIAIFLMAWYYTPKTESSKNNIVFSFLTVVFSWVCYSGILSEKTWLILINSSTFLSILDGVLKYIKVTQ